MDITKKYVDENYSPVRIGDKKYTRVFIYDPRDYPEYSAVEYLQEVIDFAREHGKLESLISAFDSWEHHYAEDRDLCVLLTKDFAPYSFSFVLGDWHQDVLNTWFNGGLIFHGSIDNYGSGQAPTLAVTLNPTDGWSVHT